MMLPVEVQANRSMFFITLGSSACKSFAVITPECRRRRTTKFCTSCGSCLDLLFWPFPVREKLSGEPRRLISLGLTADVPLYKPLGLEADRRQLSGSHLDVSGGSPRTCFNCLCDTHCPVLLLRPSRTALAATAMTDALG